MEDASSEFSEGMYARFFFDLHLLRLSALVVADKLKIKEFKSEADAVEFLMMLRVCTCVPPMFPEIEPRYISKSLKDCARKIEENYDLNSYVHSWKSQDSETSAS